VGVAVRLKATATPSDYSRVDSLTIFGNLMDSHLRPYNFQLGLHQPQTVLQAAQYNYIAL